MTVAEWCLLGAVMLYLGTLAAAKALAPSAFDNAVPRDPQFYEHPIRKRALGAHINGIETFPFFAASVLLAEFRQAPQDWVDMLAIAFLLARLAFVAAYVTGKPTARTIIWNVANAFNLGLFFLAGYGSNGAMIATMVGLAWAFALWPILVRLEGSASARRHQAGGTRT
jgi:uncharacterized MAPEG superfamily protein